jgi:hypothetical protein
LESKPKVEGIQILQPCNWQEDKATKDEGLPHARLDHKKVEQLGKTNAIPNAFDFLDRNGVLFKWNDNINGYLEGIVKKEVVLYPNLAAEIPGVVLNRDQPVPLVEDKIRPQGRVKDAAARNAIIVIEPSNVTGMEAPAIVHANNGTIDETDDNN